VIDAAGAVALDVAVATHRRRAGPFPADIAAQQKQVHDFADGVDSVFLLGQSQTPGHHRAVGTKIDLGQFSDRFLVDAGLVHYLGPAGLLDE
jgi:hypothetical protein